jgi:small ligand-binding sensory domain FIST
MSRYAAALSEHPLTTHAIGETAGQVLEAVGERPDLAVIFVTAHHGGAIEDAARVVHEVLRPAALVGCTAESVVGGNREVEAQPGISLWAGHTGPAVTLHLVATQTPDGVALTGWPEQPLGETSGLVLLADPFSFPVEPFLARMDEDHAGLPVIGGLASAAQGPGGNRLVVDERVVDRGAVGVFLGPSVEVRTVVSQGCRPVGRPLVVTKAEHNVIYELAGRPALERLQELVSTSSTDERELLTKGLHLGHVIDEHKDTFDRGDFLVRNVIGADRESGALAVGELCDVGSTVQFHVRDAVTADEDLRALLAGQAADGALLFTCNGRGTRLFGSPDHDAETVTDALGGVPLAGFFCAGEIGPVGSRNFLHGFTASVALLRSREQPRESTATPG